MQIINTMIHAMQNSSDEIYQTPCTWLIKNGITCHALSLKDESTCYANISSNEIKCHCTYAPRKNQASKSNPKFRKNRASKSVSYPNTQIRQQTHQIILDQKLKTIPKLLKDFITQTQTPSSKLLNFKTKNTARETQSSTTQHPKTQNPKIQKFKNSKIQKFKNSKIQNSKLQTPNLQHLLSSFFFGNSTFKNSKSKKQITDINT